MKKKNMSNNAYKYSDLYLFYFLNSKLSIAEAHSIMTITVNVCKINTSDIYRLKSIKVKP